LEATDHIRKEFPSQKQPFIIALTANAFAEDREKYLNSGMNAVLTKPINRQTLKETLESFLFI